MMGSNNSNSNSNSNLQHICTLNTQDLSSPPHSLSLSSDDLFVDQLLNLNHHDDLPLSLQDDSFLLTPSSHSNHLYPFHSDFDFDFDPHLPDFPFVLSVPPAEEADLEWLSHFVEESFSQFSSPYPEGIGPKQEHPKPKPKPKPEPEPDTLKVASFTSSPPGLNRSRRSKRVWTRGRVLTTALPESSSASSSSSGPSSLNPEPAQSQRKRGVGLGQGPGSPRRCTHCGVQKTPQWRIGPLGPKSLCNACGVRYKSGRLLPEYRPACSPTFSSELHSNSHKKVLEMRREKGVKFSGRV